MVPDCLVADLRSWDPKRFMHASCQRGRRCRWPAPSSCSSCDRSHSENTDELNALLLAVAGVEEETELTGRWNDTRIVQYLKPVPDTTETPVTDTVSDATDEDMFVSGGGSAADVDAMWTRT